MEATFHGFEKKAGIYTIRNAVNGCVYFGEASLFKKRYQGHLRHLQGGTHPNRGMQSDFNVSPTSFSFEVLAVVPDLMARRSLEERVIGEFFGGGCYNSTIQSPPSMLGYRHTEETKARIGAASRGKPRPESVREKISASHKGIRHSEETKAKLSLRLKGRTLTDDHKKKIGSAHQGRKRPPEVGERIRAKKLGHLYGPMSDDHKKKISEALKRKFALEERVSHG